MSGCAKISAVQVSWVSEVVPLLSLKLTLVGAASYFYSAAGLAQSDAYSLQLGQFGLGIVGVLVSWWAMTYIGRRTLYVWGLLVLCSLVFIVGFLSLAPNARNPENPNVAISWASGSMILLFTGIYNFTVGPVCYSLVAEMPSTRLRQKTVVLARNFYNVCGIMLGVLIPYMLNPAAWNLMGASGEFFHYLPDYALTNNIDRLCLGCHWLPVLRLGLLPDP